MLLQMHIHVAKVPLELTYTLAYAYHSLQVPLNTDLILDCTKSPHDKFNQFRPHHCQVLMAQPTTFDVHNYLHVSPRLGTGGVCNEP